MKNGKKAVLFGIISALILFWGTTGGTAAFAASPSAQPTSFKFRTPFAPAMAYGQFYAAQALYWPKLNLDGTVLPGKGSAAATQTVGAGSEQMGYSDTVSLMNAIQQGMPIKTIAVIGRRDPTGIVF
ncbi:MAG: ABC transporter substrate-binding protein, partial [Dehalococcoidia bacterium]|nr:ABC transporter substrate-binding protein [Dehalococcoidia bacterium]